jgi:hypothetical protein
MVVIGYECEIIEVSGQLETMSSSYYYIEKEEVEGLF